MSGEGISTTLVPNPEKPNPENQGITPAVVLNNKTSIAGILNPETGISTNAIFNLYRVKVSFEQEHLLLFINGAYSILFCPQAEHRIKLILLAVLLKATCEKSCSTKVKTNDLFRDLRMLKALQKEIPSLVEKSGLAKVRVRKRAGQK